MLSAALREAVAEALAAAGAGALRAVRAIGGGSGDGPIAATYRIETRGGRFFLKVGSSAHPFAAEALALREIAATGAIRVPHPVAQGTTSEQGFLLLEWIELCDDGDWRAAARALAALHAVVRTTYGWVRDNSIGASPQSNAACASWAEFFRERRLRPQFACARALAHHRGLHSLGALEDRACRAADRLLARHAPPASVLHGDLWRGNLAFDASGAPVAFDPALYYGDAETDLAMTRLFGGFPPSFYAAYQAERAPAEGARQRNALYQLYHVLNHANIFGGGYVAQARSMIERLPEA